MDDSLLPDRVEARFTRRFAEIGRNYPAAADLPIGLFGAMRRP